MTFYEMLMIAGVGSESELKQILREEKWKSYLDLYDVGSSICSEPLKKRYYAPVPEELALAVARISKWRFKQEGNLLWSLGETTPSTDSLSALDAYRQFGGAILEDAIERGRTEIV
jgi:hypothetical protein